MGDDVFGDDATVHRLQDLAAKMVGKEAAVWVSALLMGTHAHALQRLHQHMASTCRSRHMHKLCSPHVRAMRGHGGAGVPSAQPQATEGGPLCPNAQVPSGTMGNLSAVLAHCHERGSEVLPNLPLSSSAFEHVLDIPSRNVYIYV